MLHKSSLVLCAAVAAAVLSAPAYVASGQSTPAPAGQKSAASATAPQQDGGVPTWIKPETPEERRQRVGPEDPGPDPDQSMIFYRNNEAFHITRFDRKWAAFDAGPGLVRPFAFANFAYELYQMNDKYVWVWVQENPPQPIATPEKKVEASGLRPEQVEYLKSIEPEFSKLDPPDSKETIVFEESSDGLPTSGSWRNSMIFADMDGDGNLDIVAPPQRGGDGLPSIWLGDGKGHWRPWSPVWPYAIDYGSVAAGDFNKDGHMDLAFAVHLQGVRVFLGDGKGNFVDSSAGLPLTTFPTRRVIVGDFDHDGYPDVAAISEGPGGGLGEATGPVVPIETVPHGKLRVFLNRDKGKKWETDDVADLSRVVGGDYLTQGKFNDDVYPDFIGSSIFFQAFDLMYLSKGKGKWEPPVADGHLVPFISYYYASAAGRFSSKRLDDAIMSFIRFWPRSATDAGIPDPQLPSVAGIDRISFAGPKPTRTSIMRFASRSQIGGMVAGDFNGDGKLDVLFTRYEPTREFVLLLGDGKGGFSRAKLKGLPAQENMNYDLQVADVNGDGRPDIAIMYEAAENARNAVKNGSIHVFLNRGPEKATTTKRPGRSSKP